MSDPALPRGTRETVEHRRALAPAPGDAFRAFSAAVFADGALDTRTGQLVAVPVAPVTPCPRCIEGHVKASGRLGASAAPVLEAIRVAVMRAGASCHAVKAVQAMRGGAG